MQPGAPAAREIFTADPGCGTLGAMVRILVVASLVVLGCGSSAKLAKTAPRTATAYSSDVDQDEDSRCVEETPTGSLIPHTFCRDELERTLERKDVEMWMSRPAVQGVVK